MIIPFEPNLFEEEAMARVALFADSGEIAEMLNNDANFVEGADSYVRIEASEQITHMWELLQNLHYYLKRRGA